MDFQDVASPYDILRPSIGDARPRPRGRGWRGWRGGRGANRGNGERRGASRGYRRPGGRGRGENHSRGTNAEREELRGEENSARGQDARRGRGRRGRGQPRLVGGRHASVGNTVAPMTASAIQALSVLDSEELVKRVYSQLKEFQQALGHHRIRNAVICILLKLAQLASKRNAEEQSTASRIIAEILSERSDQFHMQLRQAVGNGCTETLAHQFCCLFGTLLDTFSSLAWDCLPIDELHDSVKRLEQPPLLKRSEELCKARDQIREAATTKTKQKPVDDERDDSEFRLVPVLPEWKEINRDNGIPDEVRPNKIDTPYKDWLQYYDIQFRLIREDFIAPLRRGVATFLQGQRGKNRDVKTYSGAVIVSQLTTKNQGICFRVKFDVSGFQRVKYNWEQSKRLIFGSLLCFIPMGKVSENDIMFATVADRDSGDLGNGYIMVQFEGDILNAMTHCRMKTEFEMVESNSYFGATSPILRSIQKAEVETMPFAKQLIEGNCDKILPPAYLQARGLPPVYNLSCLHGEKRKLKSPLNINILDQASWEKANNTELDTSQLHAIQTALTQEIAVIQGPPGTGKTYIGLKIVEGLLENRPIWDPRKTSPILVMCFTNHALDQFLEGIIDTECCGRKLEVIRVGGRCKNEKVEECNLNKIRRNLPKHHRAKGISHEIWRLRSEMEKYNPERVWQKLRYYHNHNRTELLPLDIIQDVAHPDHFYQLTEMAQSEGKEVEFWLGLWEEKFFKAKAKKGKQYRKMNPDGQLTSTGGKPIPKEKEPIVGEGEPNKLSGSAKGEPALEEREPISVEGQPAIIKGVPALYRNKVQKRVTESHQTEEAQGEDEELVELEDEATIAQDNRMNDDDMEGYQIAELPQNNTEELKENDVIRPHYHVDPSDDETETEGEDVNITRQGDSILHETDTRKGDTQWENVRRQRKSKFLRKNNADITIRMKIFKDAMDEEEAQQVHDIRSLSMDDRWRLYNFWEEQHYQYLLEMNRERVNRYSELCRQVTELRQQEDRHILEKADVVGMTTTGAAKYQHILHKIKPKIVIVEEAAEVLEAHIVSALSAGTQHLILIGDHKQLRPKPNEYELATKYNLSISLFERLVRNDLSRATLEIQHRMRPEIARLVHPHVYDKLEDHESVKNYPEIRGISKNLYFIHHNEPESENQNLLSYQNEFEAKYLVGLCAHLFKLGYSPSQITILTPYVGQLLKLRDKMPKNKYEGVRITAIDNFQGEENDIILFSMVRSTNPKRATTTIGFVKEDNRVCVSLSRAKHGFYVIGNFQLIRQQTMLWESIISDVEDRGCFGSGLPLYCCNHPETKFTARKDSDFAANAPNGGCQRMCDIRLLCGHSCTQTCHIVDREHEKFRCMKTCERSCPYNHPCKAKHYCYKKKCPPCREIVERVIPECGHTQSMECWIENPACMKIVPKVMPSCRHVQDMYCSTDPAGVLCKAPCSNSCVNEHPCQKHCYEDCGHCFVEFEKGIPVCNHKQMVPCYLEPVRFKCQASCPKLCSNDLHPCPKKCSESCENCKVDVQKTIPVCGHVKKMKCYKEPDPKKCKAKCEKVCPNELHVLKKVCRDEWPQCKEKVLRKLKCGHDIEAPCFKDPSSILCTSPCTKSCELRGHKCPKFCHEECAPCSSVVEMTLKCGHTLAMRCAEISTQKCSAQCSKVCCKRGHTCKKECHHPLPCPPCNEIVDITMPACSHKQSVKCFVSKNPQKYSYSCKHPCEKRLECGHMCQNKCGECCQKVCKEKVKTTLVCGHQTTIECCRTKQKEMYVINCKEIVTVKAVCGHTIRTECWKQKYKSALREECKARCTKTLKCGHQCKDACSNKCTTNCKTIVKRKWPCGHELKRECYKAQDMEQYPCDKQCRKKLLTCGHQCRNRCGVPCSTCGLKSFQSYPCGHFTEIPCNSTIEDHPCRERCQAMLSCGHHCSGKCGDCFSSRMHAFCIFQIKLTRYCGHSKTLPCAGLTDVCNKMHNVPCTHGEDYSKCRKLCEWNCEHFKCEKDCSEECDRPPCDSRCEADLSCGHQCPGLCGERCMTVCPECDPDNFKKQFHPKFKCKRGGLSSTGPFLELNCGHIFTVQYLDEYVKRSDGDVMPKLCPKCHQIMIVDGRYGNAVKRSMTEVNDVSDVIKQHASFTEIEKQELRSSIRELRHQANLPYLSYLSYHDGMSREESCLVYCQKSYCTLFKSYESKHPEIHDIRAQLNTLVTTLSGAARRAVPAAVPANRVERERMHKTSSLQLLKDFISELYRCALHAQCVIAREQYAPVIGSKVECNVSTVERVLNSLDPLKDRISESNYEHYFGLITTAVPVVATLHVQTPPFPPVVKGKWKKCGAGHYYCTPPFCGGGTPPDGDRCPECCIHI